MDNIIQNSLFEYVKVMFDTMSEKERAKQPQFQECQITDIIDAAEGTYYGFALGTKTLVHSGNTTRYNVGDNVYILRSQDDNSNIILGLTSASSTPLVESDVSIEENKYFDISNDFIATNGRNFIQLCSYGKNTDIDKIEIPISNLFNTYLKNSRKLSLSCDIKTMLNYDRQFKGNYTLKLTIPVYNTILKQNDNINFSLNVNNILGNPYALEKYTHQDLKIVLDDIYECGHKDEPDEDQKIIVSGYCEDFVYGDKIIKEYINKEDFPEPDDEDFNIDYLYYAKNEGKYYQWNNEKQEYIVFYDIFIKNIRLTFQEGYSERELEGYSLKLLTSGGLVFTDADDKKKVITPKLTIDGKETAISNYGCYWFRENVVVTKTSDKYCVYGGYGWECLNENLYSDHQATEEEEEEIIIFDYHKYALEVYENEINNFMRYKCVVVNNNEIIAEQVVKITGNDSISIKLSTDAYKNTYIKNIGTVTVNTEVVDKGSTKADGESQTEAAAYSYHWARYDENGQYIEDDDFGIGSEIKFPVYKISQYNNIYCTVMQDKKIIGTEHILISVSDFSGYRLIITEADKIYKYDVDGDSPMIEAYDGPLTSKITEITPLHFKLYKPSGEELTKEEYKQCKNIKWKLLDDSNSMIIIKMYLIMVWL